MGYCIGVGNLWRFPYLCGKHGGGAFLFAYGTVFFTCAGPLFFYETVMGQTFQRGPVETFRKMAPRWRGLAYMPVCLTVFYLPYYQLIVTYAFHYFVVSWQSPLPWVDNTTPDKYFEDVVLWRSPSLGGPGSNAVNGRLVFELLIVWVITVLCLIKGIHSAGKAAYVTVILPVVMLVILFFACIQLEGAGAGLHYYLTPRFERLLHPEVWSAAAGQIIFSLSPGMGTCISLASYHRQEYEGLFTDCAFIAACNSAFSLFGGVIVFAVVGDLARSLGKPVEEVAASGEGLAFIVFAQGLTSLGSPTVQSFFAVLFFLTLFFLGLDTTFAVVETLQTYVNDWLLSKNPGQKLTAEGNALRLILLSCSLFLASLPYATRGGVYLLEIADHFVVTYTLVITVFLEYLMVGHVYGAGSMLEDIYASTGLRFPEVFQWQIKYVAPFILAFLMVFLVVGEFTAADLDGYPAWAVFLFGVFPVCVAVGAFGLPVVQFKLRRLLWSRSCLSEDGSAAIRARAVGGGFKDPHMLQAENFAEDVSLSPNRA